MPFIPRRKQNRDDDNTNPSSSDNLPFDATTTDKSIHDSKPNETMQPLTTSQSSQKKQFFNRIKPQIPTLSIPGLKPRHETPTPATDNKKIFDPEREARHAARRAARDKLEEEWTEKYDQNLKRAKLHGEKYQPLEPLPSFTSDSEDENTPVRQRSQSEIVPGEEGKPFYDAVVGEGLASQSPRQVGDASRGLDFEAVAATASSNISQYPSMRNTMSPAPVQQQPQSHSQPNNSTADAQLAEMFGAQAFSVSGSYPTMPVSSPQPQPQPQQPQHSTNIADFSHLTSQNYSNIDSSMPPPNASPQPYGWGDVYNVRPEPMFGVPSHLRSRTGIDPKLEEKIYRGRELGRLAIEQEEQGNLGAAQAGYMKALDSLLPALKELDVGTDASKEHRMKMKAKIRREAVGMLDRCEELKTFLKANTSQVPTVMPKMPTPKSVRPKTDKPTGGNAPTRPVPGIPKPPAPPVGLDPTEGMNSFRSTPVVTSDADAIFDNLPSVPDLKPPGGSSIKQKTQQSLPPPPTPPTFDPESSDFLMRMKSRKNVLANASAASFVKPRHQQPPPHPQETNYVPPGDVNSGLDPTEPKEAEKCFMCNAPADLRAKCSHAFCSNCGNQAVSVFGKCPVPKCKTPMSVTDFTHI